MAITLKHEYNYYIVIHVLLTDCVVCTVEYDILFWILLGLAYNGLMQLSTIVIVYSSKIDFIPWVCTLDYTTQYLFNDFNT